IHDTRFMRISLLFLRRSLNLRGILRTTLSLFDVHAFRDGPCATDRNEGSSMEPVSRPFCPRFRTLPTFVARSLRNFKASVSFIRLKQPQIPGFGSQRMCPSCGLITSRSKAFCLECGKPLPAVYLA